MQNQHDNAHVACKKHEKAATGWSQSLTKRSGGAKCRPTAFHAAGAAAASGSVAGGWGACGGFWLHMVRSILPRSPRSFPHHRTAIPDMRRHFRCFSGHSAGAAEVLAMFAFSKIHWHPPGALGPCGALGGLLARRSGGTKKSANMVFHAAGAGRGFGRCPNKVLPSRKPLGTARTAILHRVAIPVARCHAPCL